MPFPALDPSVDILPGTDLASVWDRFEVFEALHHTMQICNPMSSAQLDDAIDALGLDEGLSVFDVACGYGELLLRCAGRHDIAGTGLDLSPWMISQATRRAAQRCPDADLRWVLGEARDHHRPVRPDVVVCVGAEWIWHDFRGTVRALAQRVTVGGRVMVGAARLHHDADPAAVASSWGAVTSVDDMADALAEHRLEPILRIDPDDDAWDRYIARTAVAAHEWAERHPGERSQKWLSEQQDWAEARERDREIIGWSVWVARAAGRP